MERLRNGERFDAILTDMMMPEMSGIQFYEQLQREMPEQARKILFMSGGAFGPEAQSFIARVGLKIYQKPLDLPQLAEHMRRLAEGRELEPMSALLPPTAILP